MSKLLSMLIVVLSFNFQNDWLAVLAIGSARRHMGDCTLERTGSCPEVYYFDRCYFTENRIGKWEYINILECIEPYNTCVLSHFSHVWLFATLWTVAPQALLSLGFPRQEYSSGLPFPSPGDLPDLASNPHLSLTYPALAGSFPPVLPGKQDPVSPYNKSFYLWVGPFKASSFEYSLVLGFLLNKNFE